MVINLTDGIKLIHQEKGIPEELITSTIEIALGNAYRKYFGTTENLVIKIEDNYIFTVCSKKEVVDVVDDDLFEVSLLDAQKISPASAVGDKIDVPCNPEDFGRIAIHSAKQIILQKLKEIEKNTLYSEFKSKEGELVIGYIQRVKEDGSLSIDLGNYEGILPKINQPPHEVYQQGERIKTLVGSVRNNKKGGVGVFLTRKSPEFVRKLIEVEIPELYDGTVKIINIVREAGYRTKIAVHTEKDEVDPVGACVGQKGVRIQNIIKELEGEKIDVLKYSLDNKQYIVNALTPAMIRDIIIIDENEKKAMAVVDESQLSFAIGKRGANIKLAKMLTGWNIEVKTQAEAIEAGYLEDHFQRAEDLFSKEEENICEIENLELPENIIKALMNNQIFEISQLISITDFSKLTGFDDGMKSIVMKFIEDNFEIVEEKVSEVGEEEDGVLYYNCPECGSRISENDTHCPNCGVEIEFEEE